MSVLARRMARAFYYFNRAKPDMRKSNAERFPNEHGSYPLNSVLRMNVRYVAFFPNEHGSYLPIAVSSVYTLFNNNVLIFLCLFLSYFFLGRIICL